MSKHRYYCHNPSRVNYYCDNPSKCPWMDDYGHCDYRGTNKPVNKDDWIDQVMEGNADNWEKDVDSLTK